MAANDGRNYFLFSIRENLTNTRDARSGAALEYLGRKIKNNVRGTKKI
jgi:hypothetical protein